MSLDWDNTDSLANVLDTLAENPDILIHYRKRSPALRPKCSWARQKEKYIELLRRLTGIEEVLSVH